jgi:hypothetical protein
MYNTRIIYKLFKEDNNLGTLVGRGHLKWEIDLKFTFVLHGYTVQWVEIIISIAPVFSQDIYEYTLKFRFSVNVSKICKNLPLVLTLLSKFQDNCKIFSNFVAF